MARLVFEKGRQRQFLVEVMQKLNLNSEELGDKLGIAGRSARYWLTEETIGDERKLQLLSREAGIPLPKIICRREEYWSARQQASAGALARYRKYGPPGDIESRRKGGRQTALNRRLYPERYKHLSWRPLRTFTFPALNNNGFAELVGIFLGDGGITSSQVHVTLNAEADKEYVLYVKALIERLFGVIPHQYRRHDSLAEVLTITGVDLIHFLVECGMVIGDKVRQQVSVPGWIQLSKELSRYCLRGLLDTDGGVFIHRYWVRGKRYAYFKLNFTNMSQPLRHFVYLTLQNEGFHPKYFGINKVWLYSESETRKYVEVVGSSNQRILRKFQ